MSIYKNSIYDINDNNEKYEPNNSNDMLVVTIAIQTHGTIVTYELDPETANVFDNVRLLCKSGGLKDYTSKSVIDDFRIYKQSRNKYYKDVDISTYNIIKNESGTLLGNVTFDKVLSRYSGQRFNVTDRWQGVYLISIHHRNQLIYPHPEEPTINLLNVSDLQRLANDFGSNVPEFDIFYTVPNKEERINDENKIKSNNNLSEEEKTEKIAEIRNAYINKIYKWNVTINKSGKIESIKLSYLVYLIKQILGNNIFINLLDYSCSNPSSLISKKQTSKYAMYPVIDIEMGSNTEYGGKRLGRKKRKTRRHKKRYSRKYRK